MFAFNSISAQKREFMPICKRCALPKKREEYTVAKEKARPIFFRIIHKYCKLRIPPAAQDKVNIVNANKDSQIPEQKIFIIMIAATKYFSVEIIFQSLYN